MFSPLHDFLFFLVSHQIAILGSGTDMLICMLPAGAGYQTFISVSVGSSRSDPVPLLSYAPPRILDLVCSPHHPSPHICSLVFT
jgi:hypothetical protein